MIPVIVLRPQPDCDATVSAAQAMGLDARGFPSFAIVPRDWVAPPLDSFDALLIGSANAIRYAGPALEAYRGKPAVAVGARTAEAARGAGLVVVATGSGGLQETLGALRLCDRRLLRLAGEARVQLVPPMDVTITERIVYASEPLRWPAELATLLDKTAVVLLHSAEAARYFVKQCDALRIDRARLFLAVIGPRVAGAVGDGWGALKVALAPCDSALLALVDQMCQS